MDSHNVNKFKFTY